jgi:predicted phage tail protein
MNQKTLSSFFPKRAIVLFFLMLVSFSLLLSSFSAHKMTDDMWKILGITKQSGDEKIKTSFTNGYLYYYGIKNLKNLASGDRGALAKDLLTYTKQYINSPVFAKEYEQTRKSAKPQEPVLKPLRSIEEIQKEEIAKAEKSIKDTEKNMKEMPQYAKTMEPMLEILKKNLKDYQNPKNTYFTSIAMGEKYDQESQVKNHKDRIKQWETAYPENPDQLIAERLQKMLNAIKDIDYNAELAEKWGKKRFVNPAYESKNPEWKQGFRAGKEVTESARAFAQKWLNELQAKK